MFRILGPLQCFRDGGEIPLGPPQQQAVLAVLLLARGAPVPIRDVARAIWGDDRPSSAPHVIRTYVQRLRRLLGPNSGGQSAIHTGTGGYAMPESVLADLDDCQEAVAAAERHRAASELRAAAAATAAALGLWRGTPLAGLPGPAAARERARLAEWQRNLTVTHLGLRVELGEHGLCTDELVVQADRHPQDERFRELLMLALFRSGQQARALEVYHEFRTRLADELGLDPGPRLQELHERILRADPALALPAKPAPADPEPVPGPAIPAELPAALPVFIGRDEQLASVLGAAGPGPLVVHGPAGVGKTAFALEAAHRLARHFPDGQLFIGLHGFDPRRAPYDWAQALARLLGSLGVAPAQVPTDLPARAALYRTLLADRQVLVVLDDALDAAQVRPLLPSSPGSRVLITSRMRLTGLKVTHQAQLIGLDPFTEAEARAYLDHGIGAGRTAAEPDSAARIATACAGLPLALAVAAARATETDEPLAELARGLDAARDRLDALAMPGDPAADVRSVFSWSYRALTPPAARLFRLLALHPGPYATGEAAAALLGERPAAARAALDELAEAHLLAGRGRFTIHDLLHSYAAELNQQHDDADLTAAARNRLHDHHTHHAFAAARLIAPFRMAPALPPPSADSVHDLPADAAAAYRWLDEQYPVLRALVEEGARAGEHELVWRLAWALETYLDNSAAGMDSLIIQRAGLAAARALGDRVRASRAHRSVSRAHYRLRRVDDAVRHARVALRLLPEDAGYLARAESHRHLSMVLTEQGQHHEALEHAKAGLRIHQVEGDDLERTLMAESTVAWAYLHLGDHVGCMATCERVLAAHTGGHAPFNRADVHYCAGLACQRGGCAPSAREHYHRAVELYRSAQVKHGVATVLERLAELHDVDGDQPAAREARQQSLAIYEELGDPRSAVLAAQL